eukprot:COSAG06_NODE_6090_length_3116_cov_3.048724_3_plen_49_part_00
MSSSSSRVIMRRDTSSVGIFFGDTIGSTLTYCAGDQVGARSASWVERY